MPGNDQTALPTVDLNKTFNKDTPLFIPISPLGVVPVANISRTQTNEAPFFSIVHAMTPLVTPSSTTVIIVSGSTSTITYRMRGYFVSANQFEFWVTSNPASPPPSGHSLTDITIIGSY